MARSKFQIITIDGPAGAGKSSTAKCLAQRLNFFYLDTGAMYRAVTLKALRKQIDFSNRDALVNLTRQTKVIFEDHPLGVKVFLDGEDVSLAIRTNEVSNHTFHVAQTAGVREILVGWQRSIGESKDIVVEGRDAGTIIFPNATYKFYLDADLQERTRRRNKDLVAQGAAVDLNKLQDDLKARDERDSQRETSPLVKAKDAIVIDSTHMTIDQTVDEILKYMK